MTLSRQDAFDISTQDSEELVRSLATETNDMMHRPQKVCFGVCFWKTAFDVCFCHMLRTAIRLALYLGSMLRSTVALHNLINNKMKNKKVKAAASVHIAPPPFGLLA